MSSVKNASTKSKIAMAGGRITPITRNTIKVYIIYLIIVIGISEIGKTNCLIITFILR